MNNKEIYLSFNMIVQNEAKRIKPTLDCIKNIADEIVIVDGGSTDNTVEICKKYTDKIFYKKFNGNFSEQKNFANFQTKGRWIFNIDADEILNKNLVRDLKFILKNNESTDIFYLARKNTVEDLDLNLAKIWGWNVDKNGIINFPDWQGRLYKRNLHWEGKVHERITGYQNFAKLPAEFDTGYYLIHHKTMDKQIKQNQYYEKLM